MAAWVAARRDDGSGPAAGRIDLRPIIRANMTYGGELVELPRRIRREKARPVVVLADVSGSMERYARMLLQFVYGMSSASRDVESFVFSTGLTRVTREVARSGSGKALAAVARRVRDWGGGTRIGDALRAFNVHYARRVDTPRPGRDHHLRRMGSRRPGATRARAGAGEAQRSPADLAQSPARFGELRAAHARHAGGAAADRRFSAGA